MRILIPSPWAWCALTLAAPIHAQEATTTSPRNQAATAAQTTTASDRQRAAPTDASSIPARPKVMFNRWQEDWSPLADPALRTEPLDRLKYLPLGSAGGSSWLTFGAGLRERFETLDATSFGADGSREDSYVISRGEMFAQLHAGSFQAFVELQSDFAPGKRVRTAVDADRLDLEQGFVSLAEPLAGGALTLRVGRQQMAFDTQRFVSVRNGPNVRQSFDAAWGSYERGRWQATGFYSQPVVNRDRRAFDDFSNGRYRFSGARLERRFDGGATASFYRAWFANDKATFLDAPGRERRDIYDARYAGTDGPIDWDFEAMGQLGHAGGKRVRAWAIGWKGGYTLPAALEPRLGIQADAASGDRHPGDRTLGTFNPLFPNGAYVTLSGLTGYVNFIHLKPSVTLTPKPGLTILTAVAAQWRMTTADAVYTQPDIPVDRTAGRGRRWTGLYGQVRADWAVTANLALALEALHFGVGRTIRDTGGRDADYLGVESQLSW